MGVVSRGLIYRNITPLAEETLADTPITVIAGARQVGKTTLLRQLIEGRGARLVNLDATVDRQAAEADPDGFAQQYPGGILAIDEIQRVPRLLLALKNALEADRRPSRFLVTGSADLLTLRGAQESLAGRAQTVPLQGLSQGESRGRVEDFPRFIWDLPRTGRLFDTPDWNRRDYLELVTASSYPEIHASPARTRDRWLGNYLDRVLGKDAIDIPGINYPDRLRPLLAMLAAQDATEFVAANYARWLDLPARSLPTYLGVLEKVFLVRRLPAWKHNVAARLASKPKTVVADSGLAAFLCGVDVDGLERDISSAVVGGLLEGFVASELSKQQAWSQVDFELGHYREAQGRGGRSPEVDLVLENRARQVVGIEVKATTSVTSRHFRGLERLREKAAGQFVAGAVLYTGPHARPFGDRLWALPVAALWEA
ncbi:MAG: ATP-binding protein, partial [Bifidobacteriaceae bacterium]|jgi:predicted AAA+ superfamily ATPase|nr:ATP-binding protein [Bifidobacteriaceae bacterium]